MIGTRTPHFHLHLLPRYPGTPREIAWHELDESEGGAHGGAEEIADLVERLKHSALEGASSVGRRRSGARSISASHLPGGDAEADPGLQLARDDVSHQPSLALPELTPTGYVELERPQRARRKLSDELPGVGGERTREIVERGVMAEHEDRAHAIADRTLA